MTITMTRSLGSPTTVAVQQEPEGPPVPINLWFEKGDRVRLLDSMEEGIRDAWFTILSVEPSSLVISAGNRPRSVPLSRIVAHQKPVYFIKTLTPGNYCVRSSVVSTGWSPTPSWNYFKARAVLRDMVAARADRRVLELWRSKMEHGERLCAEAGIRVGRIVAPRSG